MLVRDVEQIRGTERDVDWGNGKSYRLVTAADNVGYTVCHTVVSAGTTSFLQYRNHLESCYCISGLGWVREVSGTRHRLRPGVIYILNDHQPHYLCADEDDDLVLLSIFNPPLVGTEKHNLNDSVASSY
ncbi:ectoine synthase [Dactylosporangium roseum]|uniref:L-ectoine synthase n=1 Tax=Dactylosporangium roseum TaxID=47989 RepID=A0ABY5Z2F6_9ACTN|nr:ectoine synthase [Dactylosporangium roseum]UWZ36201.1 ectoine synthase [Dactylosporangium roseum]